MAQIKMKQMSEDFGMKTKDIITAFQEVSIEKTTSASVDTEEFEIFVDALTRKHQIENIDDYLSGKATIRVKKESKGTKA